MRYNASAALSFVKAQSLSRTSAEILTWVCSYKNHKAGLIFTKFGNNLLFGDKKLKFMSQRIQKIFRKKDYFLPTKLGSPVGDIYQLTA